MSRLPAACQSPLKEKIMIKNLLALIGLIALVLAAIGIVWVYTGRVDVAADGADYALVDRLLITTRERAVGRSAQTVAVDLPELTDDLLLETVAGFEDMCAACHTPPGASPSALSQGLNPPAPDLTESAARLSPEAIFWTTKHGIRMTGMPAWGLTHGDDELWSQVALIARFPEFGEGEYAGLLETARAAGVEHVHDHHDHDHEEDALDDDHLHDDHAPDDHAYEHHH
jgi:hypothetical protein